MVNRMFPPLLRLQSDEVLARLAAAGARGAFDVLVERHRPGMLRACTRILPEAGAEDAVQQALLNAHQALRRNGAPERLEPWLHRIAVNAALKELRRFPEELPLDEERTNGVEQPPERQERRERLRAVVEALGALPAGQRRALLLRELEGRSHIEIARSLGLTPGAVRQLIHRARSGVRSMVSALTPYGLLMRLAAGDGESPSRLAELLGGGVGGAAAGKTMIAALVAGGVAGGIAMAPEERPDTARAAGEERGTSVARSAGSEGAAGIPRWGEASHRSREGTNRGSSSSGEGSGRGSSGSSDLSDHSGPGGGSVSSGSGSGADGGSSGSGSSGSGSSGSGFSGSGSSGSVSSGSGTSGSVSSGSGTSGSGFSGSGTSGSVSSGSGTSGSASSGDDSSGSGSDAADELDV
jgi:RNA polymerase sigma factor (sigma-70 family)